MSRATPLIRTLSLVSVLLLAGLVGRALTVATITSDRPEYFPGETVTLTGAGWTPGETVTIVLHRDPFVQGDTVLTSVADASGTITNTSFTPTLTDLGVTFFVTATGSQSGQLATGIFKAKKKTWTGAVSVDWSTAGNWNPAGVPEDKDDLTIPAGVSSGRYPIVSSAAFGDHVMLTAGSGTQPSVTVSGGSLSVGNLSVEAGTLNVSGGTLLVTADIDVSSGATVSLSGTGVIHMANAIGNTPSDSINLIQGATFNQSGGTVNTLNFNNPGNTNQSGGTYNQSGGTLRIYNNFKNTGSFLATAGTIEFAGSGSSGDAFNAPGTNQFFNVVVATGVDTQFDSAVDAQIRVRGNWTMNGTADLIGKNTRVTFNGSGAQTIGGTAQTTFRNLFVDKTAGSTVVLARTALVTNGDVIVVSGTLDLATFTLNRSALGGEMGVVGGAFLKIGGTNGFPANYTTHSFQPTSTVDYYGTNQTVTAETYGHLNLSTSGTKTMPATAMTIQGNFTMSGTASATAAQSLTVNGNFTLGPGTTFGAGASSFSHSVRGNFSNSGTFTASLGTFTFNGTGIQTIGGSNSTTFNSLNINNPGGVVLNGVNTTVNGILSFTSGNVITGPSQFIAILASGNVSRTSGHVVGNFQKFIPTGATSLTYEIGDSATDGGAYTPVTVAFASVLGAGNLTGSTIRGDHPNTGSSPVNRLKSVNRYWTFTNSGVSFTNYSATFNFAAGDVDAGANPGAFIVGKLAGGVWTAPTVGARTSSSTQITDVTSFSDFAIGEGGQGTTLGNGADPANTTVAPGGAATTVGAFTFQTDGSTDTVTAVTVTLAPGTFASLLQLQITDDAESTVYGSVNPLSDTPSIQLTTPITATTTSTQYKIRVRPESHALMPAPPGSSYALTARVSSWTGSNANHAGSDSGGTTVTIDNLSPGSVTGATATSGTTQVTLAWTNPADSDLGTIIVLRRAGSAVGDTPAEGATYSVGTVIGSSTVACVVTATATGCTDSGLTNGTVYHYKIFANDTNGNYAIGAVPTGSPVTPNVTTLGNGTEPPNATIAPGGVATMADAFTFQTGSGTDAITAVTVSLAPGTRAGVSLIEITNDAGSIVYGSVSDPSSDTPSIPLTTPITATTTVTPYKIRVTPKLHVAMPVPPGASYALTASVSSWTGTNAQAGSNGGGTTITIDNLSPGNVTSVTATTGDQQLTVTWTNPADADLGTILVLRRAGSPVAVTPTEGVKYFVGDTVGSSIVACVITAPATSCTDHEVDNGTVYHYKVFAQDTNRNYASGIVPTGSPVIPTVTTIEDGTPVSSATIAPGGAATMADAFTFQTASGTDAITAIAVTLASGTSAAVSVVEITDVAGTIVYGSVSNPSNDTFTIALTTNIIATTAITQYRVRVTPKSHTAMPAPPGTTYALTAHIDDWTGTHAKGGSDSGNTVITIDNRSPGNVSNATATAASTQVLLGWTNPADSDLGTIVVLRRAGAAVGDTPTEGVAYSVGNTVGSSTVACVTPALGCADVGLNNGTDYHYKIFAKDVDGNYATGVVPNGSPALPFSRITVTPTSGLTTTEAGGTATFTVVLISRPIADVTIGLSSSDTTQGTVNKSSLTFTSVNWNIPQTVTVTGVDDAVDDGDVTYSIVTAPAVSVGGYSGQDASDVSITSIDNDTAGITVNPTAGLFTTEAGGTATFGVVLNSQPTANVTIGVSSNDTTEGIVSPASLTFTAANWNLPQTVTVTGVNDAVADGNIVYTILTAATSTDTVYNGIDAADVSVTNIDSNTVGIIVNPTGGLTTTETGGTAAFAVMLNSQPTGDVTIGLSSSDTTEGTISVASVVFTTANWNVPQSVTITGVNDALADGDIGYTIVTAVATSSDGNYNGLNASDVSVTNIDKDTASITVTPTSGLTTTEAGGTATFTVVLNSQPTADVVIGVSSGNTLEGTVSPGSLTFTNANWNIPQTVTVAGVDDFRDDGDIGYSIVTAAATSADSSYNGINANDVSVTNTDDDTAGITVTPTTGLVTTEAGGTATFTIVLNSQPTSDVTIGLISNDPTEGTVSLASVTFTSANWNTAQTITVTGVSDAIDDGNVAYTILTSGGVSGDPKYDSLDASNVSVTNTDDDAAGIIVTPTSGLITSEIGGETPTFTVVLTSQPTANVVINLTSSDTSEGVVGPDRLTFTSANWNVPQTVTLFGANDVVDDGDIPYSVVTAPATSGDPAYSGMNASDVSVTNIDSDVAGFYVNPTSGLTTTEAGGTAHFTVVLNSQPSADVIIALSSSNPSEGTVSQASLTFTSDNWNIPQTVDVTGVNDPFDDGDIGYTIVTAAAVSADPGYNGLNPIDVTVVNVDNDTAGITVSPTFGLTTAESGGTATFTIVLNSQPTADVTIALSSGNPSEGTVGPTSVTFTTANWNTARTVTVTGANDLFDDGDVIYSIVTAAATSGDLAYNGLNASDVSVTNTDDDTAGFTLTPTSGLVTTEAGGTASFTVVLTARPTANVTLGLISAVTTEGTVNQASVTFTTDNWNIPQTVTITGVNDFLDDGDIAYDIVTTPASSSDSSYNGLSTGNVSVTNTDNDAAGIAVTPSFGLATTEGGGAATFTVVLTSQPTADVTIGLSSSDTTEGTISVSSLTFTAANWNTPRTVTVTGVNDVVDDGDISYAIVTAAATSSDPDYNLFDASNVLVTNADNDVTSISVTPSSGLTTTEAGGTATYTIVLTSQPSANVTIALSSTNTAEGTVSVSSLTFTPANWSIPQTVTVTGVNDAVDDGDILYNISNAPATSADANYNGLDPIDVAVTNADGDTAGIIVTPITGRITTEAGGTTSFAIVLRSQPTADVTIGLNSNDLTEGTVSTSTLTFTTVNWNVAQTVTVTGVNDDLDDGDDVYRIVTAAAVSADLNYGGFDAIDVLVTNIDDDTAGITVTPTAGLTTTEAGGTATFTVVLNAQPTADVVIGLNSSNTAEGTVGPSLTFTSGNWNTPQTVTVTGINDALDDGNIAYSVVTAAATSSDLNYAGIDASDVSVTNADNDAAGITVTPTSGLTTTEAGGTATFTVVLTSQPTADVTIGLSSSDATEGTVSSPSLTFTSANWNTPQIVTVTGVNDFLDDGDIAYSILTGAATSADATYAGLSAADVAVSNTDNDVAGITVSPTTPLATTEAAGTATFTVVLNTQPTQDVTIALSSSNAAEGTVLPASLVFTSANWNVAQTVTVTGADDLVVDGPITYTIVTAPAVSTDANYNTRDAADVLVTNSDNDVAGITVTAATTPLTTTEAGGTATFTVKLNTQPTANVTIALSSSNPAEGTVLPASLVFTSANWNVAQTVTVTGADDTVVDGPITYTIVTAPAVSTDANYNTRDAADVLVTNSDNDVAGITVTAATTPLTTTEAGGTATFTIKLNTQPTANVTIALSSSNPAEGTVLPASLVFTSANWNVAQTVTVTGADDAIVDGPITYTIVTAPAVSTDPNYNTRDAADVLVTNSDNDVAGITVTAATTPLTTTEASGTATFTVVLNTQPTANVTIALSSSNPAEGTVFPANLVFTSANWNVAQTVTVTGADDAVVDGPITYTIVTAPAVSTDANYNTRDAADVLVTNSDNDAAGITVTAATTPLATNEAGGTATFTVVLNTMPTANVTMALSSSNPAEGTVLPASLVFTSANWATPQTVTVTGVDDAVVDGPITYTIVTAPAVSTDANYNTRDAADVLVTNSDNDSAGITVSPPTTPLTTTEAGGTATFTVVLNTQPTANVTLALSSSNAAEGTVLPASLVFTSANWNVAQTVTVTGVDDAVVDGPITFTIVTAPAVSADANYNTRDAADVLVTNSDNDVAGITVTATPTPLATTEAGGTATFTVVLNSQPTANVAIALSSSNPVEGTVLPASLVFTSANWNVAQTVTVTGADDAVVDGPITYTVVTAPAVSTDPNYNTRDAADVLVTNADNDTAGITVTPTTGLVTTEAGGTATFTIKLNSQPTANVTIALSSSNPAEGTIFPASLIFTSANWNVAQTVTVTGADDLVVDGPITYTIVTAPAVSTDANYNTRDAADVLVTNSDNDVAGITVTATPTPLATTEAGGTATFTVVLNSQPTANVTMALSSSNPAEGGVSAASLVFTSANWNVAQTVTVTGANDQVVDGPITYTIVTAPAVSTDANYNTRDAADVLVTNSDNDVAGITVTATPTPLATTETGGTATFTVVLNSQPTANVTIALTSSDTTEGTVLPASLVFTGANWNVAQTVTVTGVDDAVVDGPITYTIVTAPAVSTDANYNTRDAADVLVTNSDNDVAGITVTATPIPLATTEAGGTATFTVVLNSQPTANVTIALTSSTPAEGTVLPASLVFTSANWNVAQTVTVTGADDAVVDGPITYTIVTAPAVSTDPNYNTRDAADVLVTNSDNDVAGITVTAATTPLTTTEAGGTATFTVVLNTQPTANVTMALSSSNPAEGTVLPASLVFTSANWNVAQTVTVTGADDLVVDGPITYTIVTAPAVSTDPNYSTRDAADVLVTNSDNDVAGITVTAATTPLATNEAGGTATFTVVLNTVPTANVTIALTSSTPAEGTVSPASLVFTSANWNVAQTVTVTGVDDAVVDGPITYTIVTAPAVSTDANYNTRDAADVLVTNSDNDSAGITVTATTTPLATTEAGGTATFTVVLNTQPTANVTLALSSSNAAEGGVAPTSLLFTPGNWNVAQTVTVTGADDLVVDGPITYTIVTAPAVSADPNYNTRDAADVLVTNTDNDVAGITVTATPTPLATTEAGGTATFTVVLNSQPTANVTIALSSSNPAEGAVSPASLVFTSANWNVAQTVTVTGADDAVVDGPITYTIATAPAVSTDANYHTRDAADVLVTNADNDAAGITVTAATTPLTTTEAGGTATFSVVLNTQPTATVTIALSSSNPIEGGVSPASLVFTSANWNVAQTVTVTGANDLVVDGPITYTIATAPAVSTDANYNTRDAADVLVTNSDNDVAGITVTATPTPLATTEAGGTATFTVVLNTQPTANVTIALTSSTPAEGTVFPASLVFTSANWNVAQTVTVTGADDLVVDGSITYTIVTAPAVSTDPSYNTRDAANVLVTNADNDVAGITVTAATTPLTTTEASGTATFTVVLNTQPTANVAMALSSSNPAEGTVFPTILVFTSANWNVAQTVTVTGSDDLVADGPITYTIVTAPSVSTDANYNTRNAADVLVTNSDNDAAGITVTATPTPLATTEAGGTATFTVVLNSQPTATVTIALTSSTPAEGTVSPASLVFTSANWNVAQTVTVTGVDDAVVDGPITYTILTAPAVSTDPNYSTRDAADVLVTNSDNDVAGITVTATTTPLATTEAGGTATFTVVLNTQPTANVTIALSSSNPAEGTAFPASLVFTSANWNVAQTVTVTGADDTVADGPITYTIVTAPAASTDANYNTRDAADVLVTNSDNDSAGITVAPTSGLTTTEAGGTATFTVVLTSQPTADVTIALSSSNPLEGTVSVPSLVFDNNNWNVAQTVTVTGVNDAVADGNVGYLIVTAPAVSSDPNYSGPNAADVSVSNTDDEVLADLSVTKTNGVTGVTAGSSVTYTVIVSNAGPGGVVGATVTDTAPANVTFGAWTCMASAGSTCPASGTGNIAASVNLLAGGTATFTVPATISATASGTVINTATIATAAGAVDPTPANNIAVDTDAVSTITDLSVTMTNGTNSVTAAGPTTYAIVVTNAGANAAGGAVITDVGTGLAMTSLACSAAGGAACPTTPTVAQLQTGLAIPTLPAGGSVTFTLVTIVTAAGGTVSNTATVTSPAGVVDTNPANNSATDSDAVVAAPAVADLAVVITDNMTVLVPGTDTVYTIMVTNQGPSAVAGVTVTNTAPAGLAFGNWTCVASAGSSCDPGGTGNIATIVNLLAGGTAVFSVPASLTPGAPASIANTVVATVPAGVIDPVPANNTATDVNATVLPQSLGLALRAGAATAVGPAAFEVPFTVDVINTGSNPLTNLQVADSLSAAFADGAPTITIAGPPTANSTAAPALAATAPGITATAPCVPNSGFTGIGSALDAGTQLLSGSPPLGAGQGCTIDFRVRLTYASAAVIPTTIQTNSVLARTTTGTGGVTIASGASTSSVQLLLPRVDVTKMLTGVKQLGSEPVFDISYALVLRNTSEVAAPNVQVTDNLADTFAPGAPVITVVSGPVIESGNASLTLATGGNAFNGTSRTAILAGSDTMLPGTESRIVFTVRVRYASGAAIPAGVDLNNSAIATTSATSGGVVITRDESTDVTDSGAPPRADDEPDPTPVRLEPQAQLSVQKIANVLVAEIGDTVQYAVRVSNLAGPALPDVSLTDKLPLGFRYIAGSARLGGDGAAQPLPDPAGGAGPVLTFAVPAQAERAEALITYRVRIGPGALQGDGINRVDAASGDIRSNTAAARVLVSGGVFTTDACVVGAIFVDLNRNGLQDAGEPGVPDVELHFEEGTSLVSDLRGKYSYCGLTPTTHVLKVDATTLPAGATLTPSGNRNGGNAGSLFVDLKFGEVHRADFIVDGSASQQVLDEIGVRQARAEVWVPKFEETARPGVGGGRTATGTGAASGGSAGGFDPIRRAAGLNSANSNAPEPLPAATEPPAVAGPPTQGTMAPSTALRPMLLVGLLDGAVSFTNVSGGPLAPARPEAVFDREFTRFTGSFDSGQGQYGGRGAVFVKGTVAKKYLMTFAYDSDKDVRGALFRDIQPEAFYPIYGDGSEKRFDAQTSGRLYARVDRGHSYLMYGDLWTSSFSPEAQALGAYHRALTGVQHHFENSRMIVNLFASHDSLRQVIDEYAARGVSGPYPVSNPNGVSGTERVEIITRDRNQPALVLSAVQLTRFTDYEFEPFSGRLLFRMPVPSLDERLNPVSIRVTYEVDAGGDKSWVGGGNVQMRLGRSLQVGGSWIEDGTPVSPYRLISATTTLRLGGSSTVEIEGAQSTGTINTGIGATAPPAAAGIDPEGFAGRIEWRHMSSRLMARAFGAISDPGFNNPASTLAGGRTEAGGRARLKITDGVSFIGEAIHSEDRLTGGRRDGGLLSLETKWKPLVFEVGMRRATETGASQGTSAGRPLFGSGSASGFGFGSTDTRIDPVTGQPIVQPGFGPKLSAGPNAPVIESPDVMTVRAKLTFLIGKRADVYGEAEQDVRSSGRRVAAMGAQLKFSDTLKLYARHEFISSLDGPYALADGQRSYNTVVGVASTYMKDADLFSEYRLGDAISGREAEAAIGLRNHWTLARGVRLSTGLERVQSIAGASREATAASVGLEYTASARLKATGRVEWRQDSSSDSWLSTVGIAQRLSRDWTMLARNYYQVTKPDRAPNLLQDRFSIGAAYRDTAKNRVNLLTRYEFRVEDTAGLAFGSATNRQVHVVSTHADVHPLRAWTFSGQHALKFVDDRTEISADRFGVQLVSGRVAYDIARRWDVGALTSVMWGGEAGRRSALGGEVGFQLRQGLWLSTGYNFTGFTDRDLVSSNFTTRGMFVRIRMKFDESVVPAAARGGR